MGIARTWLKRVPLARDFHQILLKYRQAAEDRAATRRAAGRIADYLAGDGAKKLHIGCGHNRLAGWLNSDIRPKHANVIHIDLFKPLPFPDASLDYIFSEHVIEHFTWEDGQTILGECHRVLKPGGRLRISTPDMAFVVGLYGEGKSQLQQDYIRWSSETFIRQGEKTDTFVINNFVRKWGHLFIYDPKTLSRCLQDRGFSAIEGFAMNESHDPELTGLENEGRLPPGFLVLETFTLEGVKA